MANKKSANKSVNILALVLIFVAGFTVFSLIGFIVLILLLSMGVIPVK
jgi:hypothetical protein